MRLRVAGAVAVVVASSLRGQEPPAPSFSTGVELVTVDAVVVDDKGHPIRGLTREDFALYEDGKPVDIASFEAFDLASRPAVPDEPVVVATNQGRRLTGRAFALLVDDLSLAPSEIISIKKAVGGFVAHGLRAGDEVVVGTTSGGAWWTAALPDGRDDLEAVVARMNGRAAELAFSTDQMSEYEAYAIVNRDLGGAILDRVVGRWLASGLCITGAGAPAQTLRASAPSCPGNVRARAQTLDQERRSRKLRVLAGVRTAAETLAGTRGRKSVLLYSHGFLADDDSDTRDVEASLRAANVAVYFVDARGLGALPDFASASYSGAPLDPHDVGTVSFENGPLASGGAHDLAADTGGFTIANTNDLERGAGRIAEESSVYYLLGFRPVGQKGADAWRALKVETTRPNLKVRARAGFTLRGREPKAAKPKKNEPRVDPVVARTLLSVHDQTAIPLRAMAYVFEPRPKQATHVTIAVEMDTSALSLKGDKRTRVDVSVTTVDRDTGRGFRHDDVLDVKADAAEPSSWRAIVREFELPPGVHQARVVVRDAASGAVGSVTTRFEVPPVAALRLSTPLLSDRATTKDGAPPEPALAVHRVFPAGARLYCRYQVFGAKAALASRVTGSVALRSADGALVMQAPPTPIASDADGRLVRTVVVDMSGRPAGAYALTLAVDDAGTGAHAERRESFSLVN